MTHNHEQKKISTQNQKKQKKQGKDIINKCHKQKTAIMVGINPTISISP